MAKLTESHIVVVVNGVETVVNAHPETPLRTVAELALKQTKNGGRSLSDWELKDAKGTPLDLSRKVGDFHFPADVILYLTLRVGVNGAPIVATRGEPGTPR